MSAENFRYQPLQHAREIRIIRVEPNSDIKFRIEHVNLDDDPLFTAVSYTWGPDSPHMKVSIGGQILIVRESLGLMMEELSNTHSPRYLWIDAICINQTSNEERNHQVKLMGEIYSQANYVIAYLGGSRNDSEQDQSKGTLRKAMAVLAYQIGLSATSPSNKIIKAREKTIMQLLKNKYFTRRWIIQEFCLARTLVLYFKGTEYTLDQLQGLVQSYQSSSRSRSAASLCRLRNGMASNTPTLEKLLYDHESAACSKYQDKIYALLSLAHHASQNLSVDYNLPPLELLISVIHVCSLYDGLPPSRTMSFVCFLHQLLQISWQTLCYSMQQQTLRFLPDVTTFSPQAALRGFVIDRFHGQEQSINQFRSQLFPMDTYEPIKLTISRPDRPRLQTGTAGSYSQQVQHVTFSGSNHHRLRNTISPNDLWIFAASLNNRNPRGNDLRIGLSTVRTLIHDQVWQFSRTPIAMILRPLDDGYILVGRALLLRIDLIQERLQRSYADLETVLDWIAEDNPATAGQNQSMCFITTPTQLIQLLCWINTDQCLHIN